RMVRVALSQAAGTDAGDGSKRRQCSCTLGNIRFTCGGRFGHAFLCTADLEIRGAISHCCQAGNCSQACGQYLVPANAEETRTTSREKKFPQETTGSHL